jgi:hypothetical protein
MRRMWRGGWMNGRGEDKGMGIVKEEREQERVLS